MTGLRQSVLEMIERIRPVTGTTGPTRGVIRASNDPLAAEGRAETAVERGPGGLAPVL